MSENMLTVKLMLFVTLSFYMTFLYASENDINPGIYEVSSAKLNLKHCNIAGKPINYASKFIKIKKLAVGNNKIQVSTCDGETLDEISCSGRYNSSTLELNQNSYFEGFRFGARRSFAKNGTPQCLLTALRRKVIPTKGDVIQYERADWGSTLADYTYECTREMAREFFEAQSLKCSSNITINALLLKSTTQM